MATIAGGAAEAEGRTTRDARDRLFIEAVLFRAKTGMPWRDLLERFGLWKSVYNRFNN
jgi:transposase